MPDPVVVTLDGPAGSGKTACGRLAALELDWLFIASGLYYRALTYQAIQAGIAWSDTGTLERVAGGLSLVFDNQPAAFKVFLEGRDVTEALKGPDVTPHVKKIAAAPSLRAILSDVMRAQRESRSLLAEGRDMGSVVFADAPLKLYLDADLDCRVERRRLELARMGVPVDPALLRRQIAARDDSDRSRAVAPLMIPEDAVVIDTSTLTLEGTVRRIVETVKHHVSV